MHQAATVSLPNGQMRSRSEHRIADLADVIFPATSMMLWHVFSDQVLACR